MSKVSVIIPTYNRAALLKKALISVLNQSYRKIEVIIIDDCSTDNTPQIINEIIEKDKRVKYLRNEQNLGKGASATRNKGLNYAKGTYCAFLDDDDEWRINKLEDQVKYAENYSLVGNLPYVIKNKNDYQESINLNNNTTNKIHEIYIKDIFNGNLHVAPSSLLTKTIFLKKIDGFDEELPGSVGWDLNLRLIKNFGPGCMIMKKNTIFHQEHENSRISTSKYHNKGMWMSYQKHKNSVNWFDRRWRKMSIYRKEFFKTKSNVQKMFKIFNLFIYTDQLLIWAFKMIKNKL